MNNRHAFASIALILIDLTIKQNAFNLNQSNKKKIVQREKERKNNATKNRIKPNMINHH